MSKQFRFYSIASIVALLVTGAITSLDAPQLEANLPTPGMGAWERLNVGVMMLWFVVLAFALFRSHGQRNPR